MTKNLLKYSQSFICTLSLNGRQGVTGGIVGPGFFSSGMFSTSRFAPTALNSEEHQLTSFGPKKRHVIHKRSQLTF